MTARVAWMIPLVLVEAWLLRWLIANSVMPWLEERRQRRDVIRRSIADQRMQAIEAAHQLSLLAWQTRHELYDLQHHQRD